MTQTEFWRYVIAEVKALGWRCIAYGPEAWLALVALCLVCALACVVIFPISVFRREGGKTG